MIAMGTFPTKNQSVTLTTSSSKKGGITLIARIIGG